MSARFNLELAPDAKDVVNELMSKMGLRTQTDVFENAIVLLSWAVREVTRGRIIASLDETTKQYAELQMVGLMNVSKALPKTANKPDRNGPPPRSQPKERRSTRTPELVNS